VARQRGRRPRRDPQGRRHLRLRVGPGGEAIGNGRLPSALAGAVAGLVAGGAAAWIVAADPGRGHGPAGSLRADLDALGDRLTSIEARLAVAEAGWKTVAERPASATGADETVRALAQDVRALRESVERELHTADEQFADLRRRIDDANAPPASASDAPPTPEEEDRWMTMARDADGGVRFSALQRLGRFRTDRSAHVSVERLTDEDPKVAWQALRNLGRFREVAAAAEVSALLEHAESVVRAAAYAALLDMGAPKDTGFDASLPADKRKAAAAALKAWAESR
jgi:HEAT repeat protein